MSNMTESEQVSSSAAVESYDRSFDADMLLLNVAVRSLPYYVVQDLLVCSGCLLRLFGTEENIYFHSSLSQSMVGSILEEVTSLKSEVEFQFCSVCLGILQFSYCENANDMALAIAVLVKQEGHQIDGFSLEGYVPPLILQNESALAS